MFAVICGLALVFVVWLLAAKLDEVFSPEAKARREKERGQRKALKEKRVRDEKARLEKQQAEWDEKRQAQIRAREEEQRIQKLGGPINPVLICPHCQTKGQVRTKAITRKIGISGGKATAALLTAGTTLLLTGLAQKQAATQAHCGNCQSTWVF
jgi:hypothetical protein